MSRPAAGFNPPLHHPRRAEAHRLARHDPLPELKSGVSMPRHSILPTPNRGPSQIKVVDNHRRPRLTVHDL